MQLQEQREDYRRLFPRMHRRYSSLPLVGPLLGERWAGYTNIAAACRRLAAQPAQALALIGIELEN